MELEEEAQVSPWDEWVGDRVVPLSKSPLLQQCWEQIMCNGGEPIEPMVLLGCL